MIIGSMPSTVSWAPRSLIRRLSPMYSPTPVPRITPVTAGRSGWPCGRSICPAPRWTRCLSTTHSARLTGSFCCVRSCDQENAAGKCQSDAEILRAAECRKRSIRGNTRGTRSPLPCFRTKQSARVPKTKENTQQSKRLLSVFWQGHKDLNPEPTVLETAALPIELYPYILFI